jgi:plastocyanin
MRSFWFLCFFAAQANATFTINIIDLQGKPVADAVVSRVYAPIDNLTNKANASAAKADLPIAIMDQVDIQFQPHVLVVSKNQAVNFPNSDDTRHHVYSFSATKMFELKLFTGADSNPVTMNTAGIVELGCNIHDQMLGFIYVDESGSAVKTDEKGNAVLTGSLPKTISIWHPRFNNQAKGQLIQYKIDPTNSSEPITVIVDVLPKEIENYDGTFKRRFTRKFSEQGG